jgi:hypothetical protein
MGYKDDGSRQKAIRESDSTEIWRHFVPMVVDTDKQMSAFFLSFVNEGKPLEAGGNNALTFFIDSQQN